jgi:hypothetical protein
VISQTVFLKHPENTALRDAVAGNAVAAADYYKNLLRLIYVYSSSWSSKNAISSFRHLSRKRGRIFRNYYSAHRLRLLSEYRHDLWLSLRVTFRLFEADGPGPCGCVRTECVHKDASP